MSSVEQRGWIGVDLDGTLAVYDGWQGTLHIGEPVPAMLARVKEWLAEGREVRIFTARVERVNQSDEEAYQAQAAVEDWLQKHLGRTLPVTCIKDFSMVELWDDRAVQVEKNTGRVRADIWTSSR